MMHRVNSGIPRVGPRRTRRPPAVAAALVVVLLASCGGDPVPAPDEGRWPVVTVLDAEGEPVEGTQIVVRRLDLQAGAPDAGNPDALFIRRTGSDGRCVLEGVVVEGEQDIVADPPLWRTDLKAEVRGPWTGGRVSFVLARATHIEGEVVDRAGKAVVGAELRLAKGGLSARGRSDDAGRFRMEAFESGEQRLLAATEDGRASAEVVVLAGAERVRLVVLDPKGVREPDLLVRMTERAEGAQRYEARLLPETLPAARWGLVVREQGAGVFQFFGVDPKAWWTLWIHGNGAPLTVLEEGLQIPAGGAVELAPKTGFEASVQVAAGGVEEGEIRVRAVSRHPLLSVNGRAHPDGGRALEGLADGRWYAVAWVLSEGGVDRAHAALDRDTPQPLRMRIER